MAACAGFLGMKQNPKTYEMSTVIGWYIEDYSKNKKENSNGYYNRNNE